jgi:hypothetical protein
MPSDERHEFGRRARERIVRDYDIDVIVRRYERLYEGIVARTMTAFGAASRLPRDER